MKWLSAANSYPLSGKKAFYASKSPHPQEIVADHLVEVPHPFGLYSVTRVNPLYVDEANGESQCESKSKSPADSSDRCGERDNCKTDYLYPNPLRQNVPAVVKQNADFIRSILVSVRLGHKHCHGTDLTPIPEGRTDALSHAAELADKSSPPSAQDHPHHNAIHVEKPPRYKHKRWKGESDVVASSMASPPADNKQRTLLEILRELSFSINNAMENADQVEIPPEAVLRSLREKINACLESGALSPHFTDSGGQRALKEDAVVTLSRAFSFVNSFNHGSQDGLDGGRLLLLKRLGKFSGGEPFYEHVRHSSSSSSSSNTSTSGFSDLTHTPASSNASASDSPPISRTDGMQLAAFAAAAAAAAATTTTTTTTTGGANGTVTSDDTNVIRCNDNIIMNINHNNNDNNNNSNNNNNLNNDNHNNSCNRNHLRHNYVINCDTAKDALALKPFEYNVVQNEANFNIARSVFGVTVKDADQLQTAIYTKSDSLLSSYPGRRCPDFTLDVQQAEMVMKKVNERKKERCYCRMVTSFVGFAFLLFSVMFFSMMLTRGEKMFGSL